MHQRTIELEVVRRDLNVWRWREPEHEKGHKMPRVLEKGVQGHVHRNRNRRCHCRPKQQARIWHLRSELDTFCVGVELPNTVQQYLDYNLSLSVSAPGLFLPSITLDAHSSHSHDFAMRLGAAATVAAFAGWLGLGLAHNIQLKAHTRECFHEELHKDDKMTVTFQVGDREFGGAANLDIDFYVS